MSYVWVDFTMGGPLQGDATGDLKVWFWDYDYIFRGTVEHIGAVSVSDSDSTALLLAIPLALILIFRSLKRHTPANTHPAERNLAIRRASAAVPAAA